MRTALRAPTLLVLDEFSAITAVDRAVAKLRTALQHHYRDIGIIFAGSAPAVMRSLFSDRAEPFYGQADLIEIEPLAATAVHRILADGFQQSDRDPGVTATRTMDLTGGHPQRTMQVADAVWHRTPAGTTATDERWAAALGDVRRAVADPMSRIYDTHTDSERKVLRILAHGEAPHGAAGRFSASPKPRPPTPATRCWPTAISSPGMVDCSSPTRCWPTGSDKTCRCPERSWAAC